MSLASNKTLPNNMTLLNKKARIAWRLMIISYIGLLLAMLGATFAAPPTTIESEQDILISGLIFWVFKSLPLMLFIPGLIKRSHYVSAWLCYTTLLYFTLFMALTGGTWLLVLVSTSLVLFISSMLFTRWQKAAEKEALAETA
ncbi:MAG: DUF2069 domain-containing protein [Oleibacter sp.]|nr:DUF2069 domain-containing protein [Thalassolituus sp.]